MNDICKKIRGDILKISHSSGHGHIPSCFSVVEALYSVYSTMRHEPQNPRWEKRDIFVLSKGHAALAHYCVLAHFNYFDLKRVYAFGAFGSDFGCHADRTKVPGVEVSTGSLGHGIGVAAGVALGMKINRAKSRVYVLVGDGESNEGSVWEAVMVAVNRGLDNLTIIYDNNRSQGRGLQLKKPVEIFKAFGCDAFEVDGHNVDMLCQALSAESERVKAIVANTVKGFGCKTLTDDHYQWHRRSPSREELIKMLEELDEKAV
ncbi:transketolase [Desulfocucumis palustris]|uniref:Transketolase n=1 Tax=Desulfocucumis palustris TaxID=1898651 RepID=A0A2L2XB45_9FIRM|nr:transketolase [Desulfocucumis palustris]GBF33425.1 transketolase [Desulfocucumis palustris]